MTDNGWYAIKSNQIKLNQTQMTNQNNFYY